MSAPRTVDAPDVSTPGRRIAELDVLRGFALCGILVVNILQQLVGRPFPLPIDLLFVARFLSLFALLFGVGFGLFLDRAAARTPGPRVVLAPRLRAGAPRPARGARPVSGPDGRGARRRARPAATVIRSSDHDYGPGRAVFPRRTGTPLDLGRPALLAGVALSSVVLVFRRR